MILYGRLGVEWYKIHLSPTICNANSSSQLAAFCKHSPDSPIIDQSSEKQTNHRLNAVRIPEDPIMSVQRI